MTCGMPYVRYMSLLVLFPFGIHNPLFSAYLQLVAATATITVFVSISASQGLLREEKYSQPLFRLRHTLPTSSLIRTDEVFLGALLGTYSEKPDLRDHLIIAEFNCAKDRGILAGKYTSSRALLFLMIHQFSLK
ncbi:hypothetical protein CCUS01_00815 [Colletotrichum cuscutae]|uniref:Uncharacterized protein n=1 Tax=Colletotrichum cuscutae TaxID=1209917 RepID=A0AAI9Y3X9_9PEZI|nr:hypothetical protein CCUS01_00815 [Colletotrichum cuscutae]